MCGITGIYSYHSATNRIDRAELRRMRDHMSTRGPDGDGEWFSIDDRVALGHRRLSIIDLSDRASQPMRSENGKLVIAFNGEIYNYRALRAGLQEKGHVFRTQSDTEVLLHLFAVKGRDMVHDLRGMFAFAIWDVERSGLFLARDPYGIKPLYYSDDGQTFRFASQVKALLAGGKVSRDADPAGWVGFYYFGSVPEPFTTYRQISALPAGSTLWVGNQPSAPTQYLSLPQVFAELEQQRRPNSHGEAIEIIRAGLLDSVRHHMVSDVPVGLFLSAGIDSGSLLGLMRDVQKAELEPVTLSYSEHRETELDEAPIAAKSAKFYDCKHTVRIVSDVEFREDLPKILHAMDQPSIDGINTWFVSKAAKEFGLKAAISGLGGDELFGGYPSYRDIPRLVNTLSKLRGVDFLGDVARRAIDPITRRWNPKLSGLIKYGTSLPKAYFLLRGLFMPWEVKSVVHDEEFLREGMRRLDPTQYVSNLLASSLKDDFTKVACLETSSYMRTQLLRDADWASMAHSLEVRVPFVDLTLLKAIWPAVLSLPKETGKQILAGSPSRPLPAEVVHRTKTGFVTPVDLWLQRDDRLQDWRRVRVLADAHCPWARRWAYQVATIGRFSQQSLGRRPTLAQSSPSLIIFRIGSIGDTVCALPCFHRVAEVFATYNRILLTDIPASGKAAPVEAIIGQSDLIHEVLYFPANNRTPSDLLAIRRQVRATGARVLVYIAHRPLHSTVRDLLFFYSCGIRRVIGAPIARNLRLPKTEPETGEEEYEAARLARCLAPLGQIDLDDSALWDLRLQPSEREAGAQALEALAGRPFLAANLGGKVESKDWGDDNWQMLLKLMSARYGDMGLVFFGSADEWRRCQRIARHWNGPTLNLCGVLTPRQSAAALSRARLFIGHDSGPMHLAAAVGVRCVCVFGKYNRPRRWHPYGAQHRVVHKMDSVENITPLEVFSAVESLVQIHQPILA